LLYQQKSSQFESKMGKTFESLQKLSSPSLATSLAAWWSPMASVDSTFYNLGVY